MGRRAEMKSGAQRLEMELRAELDQGGTDVWEAQGGSEQLGGTREGGAEGLKGDSGGKA